MTERWLPVVGFEDLYEVSDQGRVRSIPRKFTRISRGRPVQVEIQGKVLALSRAPDGHMQVQLPRRGPHGQQNTTKYVHYIELEAFVGPCPSGQQTRHLNDIPDDNRLENLCWGTPSEDRYDMVRNGNHVFARRTHCKWNHEFTPENTVIRAKGARGCRACEKERRAKYARTERGRKARREYMRRYRAQKGRKRPKKPPQTHCKYDHEFTPENTYVDKNGKRHCRECQRNRDKMRSGRRLQEEPVVT